MARKQARDAAMRLVYEWSMGGGCTHTLDELLEGKSLNQEDKQYIDRTVLGVKQNASVIDGIIAENSIDWKFERMPKIDVAVLRVAIYEILFCDDIPNSVAINEAVELVKRYGSDKSASFVNGLLGKYVRSLEAGHE
jgi:N utilization substance protein B